MNVYIAFSALTFIAISKTILTKVLFEHVNLPVAYSFLSCVVTVVAMLPCFAKYRLHSIDGTNLRGITYASVAISCDLAFTNIALSRLDIALQQSIKAMSPMVTLLLESMYHRKIARPFILYVVILCSSFGPVIIANESSSQEENESTLMGVVFMGLAVVTGALKNIFAHNLIKESKTSMGVISFTFWIEIACAVLIFPWTITTRELYKMADLDPSFYPGTFGVALYGGVRVFSQFYFLKFTSPTSLALSNLAVQLVTSLSSGVIFGAHFTLQFVVGLGVSLVFSALYACIKLRVKDVRNDEDKVILNEDDTKVGA